MPRPYLIAICEGSALDERTNNFTLFSLTEQLEINRVPAPIPFDTHIYYEFDEAERGRDYEVRVVVVHEGQVIRQSEPFPITSPHPRFRIRFKGFDVTAFGHISVFSEIRPRGEDQEPWERSQFAWPLDIRELRQQGGQVEQAG